MVDRYNNAMHALPVPYSHCERWRDQNDFNTGQRIWFEFTLRQWPERTASELRQKRIRQIKASKP